MTTRSTTRRGPTPAQALEAFLAKYDPAIVRIAKRSMTKVRKLVPGAVELVYDNYNALVIAFGATEKVADVVCSLALYPKWVTLFFMQGRRLDDPERRLAGSGATIRSVRLVDETTLDDEAIVRLFAHAKRLTPIPAQARRMVVRSVSPKQRPRRAARK